VAKKRKGAGWWNYLKEAFTFKWNLLIFGGAMAAAALSPAPDVLLPLVGAAELTYLTGLVSLPRFQKAIDIKHASQNRQLGAKSEASEGTKNRLGAVLNGLESRGRIRFQKLRERCLKMQRLAHGVRGGHTDQTAIELRTPGLDRLLWVFLRLLYSQQGLLRFLDATDEDAIRTQLANQTAKLEAAKTDQKDGEESRIVKSLTDSIATTELRLDNYERATKNAEFVEIELDRIETKIQALTEMAVSHQDPDYISSQVDSVADSMTHTEEAIRDLHHITGLEEIDEAPSILEADLAEVIEA
jgi:hypothetical protein